MWDQYALFSPMTLFYSHMKPTLTYTCAHEYTYLTHQQLPKFSPCQFVKQPIFCARGQMSSITFSCLAKFTQRSAFSIFSPQNMRLECFLANPTIPFGPKYLSAHNFDYIQHITHAYT